MAMNPTSMEISRGRPGVAPWLMPPGLMLPAGDAAPLKDIPVADLRIRCLRGAAEIARIVQLRDEINLAAAAAADPEFMYREKKETSLVWSLPSSCTTRSSAPS